MSDARTAILASIRDSLAASSRFDDLHESAVASELAVDSANDGGDALDRFVEGLGLVGAGCVVVESERDAAARLREIVGAIPATKIVVSDSDLVARVIESAGLDVIRNPSRDDLFASDLGVTSAQWAIAETGTLVLESSAESHRLVSLVPPVHVCLLRASSIRQSMSEILKSVDPDKSPAITFITGASRTSDIELTLAIGVHGPGELHVIVIMDN